MSAEVCNYLATDDGTSRCVTDRLNVHHHVLDEFCGGHEAVEWIPPEQVGRNL